MTQYAGEVRIKTKLDAEGVSKGLGEVGAKMRGIGNAVGNGMSGMFAKVNNGVKAIGAKLSSLGGMAAIGISQGMALAGDAIVAVTNLFKDMMKMEGFKEKFAEAELAFTNLQNAAYSALMPLMELLLPIIMQVVDWLTRAANVAAAFFAALSGSSTYMTYVASGMAKAGGSSGKYADNMERAEKAAKGSLASFDKIDVLNKKETPEIKIPGGGGGGGAIGEWVEQSVEDTFASLSDGWGAFIDGLLLLFKDGDWSGLGDWFKEFVWEPIKAKAIEIWEQFKKDISDSAKEIAAWAVGVWEKFKKDISDSAKEIWNWLVKYLFTPLKESWAEIKEWAIGVWTAIKEWAIQAWEDIKETWNAVGTWFDEKVIQPIKTFFSDAWNAIKTWVTEAWDNIKNAWQGAKDWFDGKVLQPIKKFFVESWTRIRDKVLEAWDKIKEKWNAAKEWFDTKVIKPIRDFFTESWAKIKDKVTETWDKIKEKWNAAKQWFDEKVVTPIRNFFTENWTKIKDKVEEVWEKIKEAWRNAATWFDEKILQPIEEFFSKVWQGIKDFVIGVWDGIKDSWEKAKAWFDEKILSPIKEAFETVWGGISDFIKNIINGIIGFINGMIRGIVSGINAVIGVLNKLNIKIPDWVPGLGGKSFGFNISPIKAPQIPLLATGAVIPPNAPFAAVLGDQRSGRNIEAPESMLRDLIREELSKNNGGQQEITVNFAGTMGALVRAMNPYIENERTRRGNSLAKGVNIL